MPSEAMNRTFGWATPLLSQLDEIAPGVLRNLLCAGAERRQVTFMALAMMQAHADAMQMAPLAGALVSGSTKDVLCLGFDPIPMGLLAVLRRMGAEPLSSPQQYVELAALFGQGAHPAVSALQGVDQISEPLINAVHMLEPQWASAPLLRRLNGPQAARDANAALHFVQRVCSRATTNVLLEAVAQLPADKPLSVVLERFMRRADRFPPHPLSADEDIRPLSSARNFIETGVRYRNCLATKLAEVLAGMAAYAEFRGVCILELRPLSSGQWLLSDLHAPRNDFLNHVIKQAAEEQCEAKGIVTMARPEPDRGWRAYRRLARQSELFFEAA